MPRGAPLKNSTGQPDGCETISPMLITVASGRPTFLCVEDGTGQSLFYGTLDGKQVFKAKHVRMNIGLKYTAVTVNGTPVRLDGSPAGLDITRAGGAKSLPLGQRPCG